MESFFGSVQIELLDRRTWPTKPSWPPRSFEWVEAFYDPTRRYCAQAYLIPIDYEQ